MTSRPVNFGHNMIIQYKHEYKFNMTQQIIKIRQKHDTDKKINMTRKHEYLKIT